MGGAPWKLFCQRPWDRLQPIINGASAYQDHLSPIHTGDCIVVEKGEIRRLSPFSATVAEFGDKLSPFPATIVAEIGDRRL